MRKFQISIRLHMLTENDESKELSVYADSNNVWETICVGFDELLDALRTEAGLKMPSFGVREHQWKER